MAVTVCSCHACTCPGCVDCDPPEQDQGPAAVFNPTTPDPWADEPAAIGGAA